MRNIVDSPATRMAATKLKWTVEAGQLSDDELEAAVRLLAGLLRARDAQRDYVGQLRLAEKYTRLDRLHTVLIEKLLGHDRAFQEYIHGNWKPPLEKIIDAFSADIEQAVRDAP